MNIAAVWEPHCFCSPLGLPRWKQYLQLLPNCKLPLCFCYLRISQISKTDTFVLIRVYSRWKILKIQLADIFYQSHLDLSRAKNARKELENKIQNKIITNENYLKPKKKDIEE